MKKLVEDLIARGNITSAELKELRCDSWEWEAIISKLTDEALLEMAEHAIKNSSRPRRPCSTYDEAVIAAYAPELIKRLRPKVL